MGTVIRRAAGHDAADIAHLHGLSRAAYYGALLDAADAARDREPMWRRLIGEPDHVVFCAWDAAASTLVGFCCITEPAEGDDEVQLHSLYVHPDRFGTGIADALYEHFISERRDRAARLEVWQGNARAQAFYRRRGWQPSTDLRPGPAGRPFVTWRLPARA